MKTKINTTDLLPVLGQIYDAALDAQRWPAAVQAIAALYDTDKALMMTPGQLPADGGLAVPVGIPAAGWFLYGKNGWLLPTFLSVLGLLIILRHKANIQRLIQGTENRFEKRKK